MNIKEAADSLVKIAQDKAAAATSGKSVEDIMAENRAKAKAENWSGPAPKK